MSTDVTRSGAQPPPKPPVSADPPDGVTASQFPNPDATASQSPPGDTTVSPPDAAPPPSDVPTLPPGFEFVTVLARGGMGVIYLARQIGLNRLCAIKLVGGTDSKSLIRFLAEAELVAAIRHPNVVEVYQYGEHGGHPYLALEYCPGGDLAQLTRLDQARDAAWVRKVAELMAGVADGVQAAHQLGIIHRDLKPHNVLLAADGTPKVADFGLAKRVFGSDLTITGALLGTPAYMSPEQASGGAKFVGPESDVWALGVMLYELTSGVRPFAGVGAMELLAAVTKGDVPALQKVCPTVPQDLALIVTKCLQRDAKDRYPTAGPLATDLRNWLAGKPISARPAGPIESAVKWAKRNKRVAAMGAAVLLTMATATAVSVGWATKAVRAEADTAHQLEQTRRLEREKGEAVEQLKAALAESRRKTALNYLAYGQMCGAASRAANAPDRAAADPPWREFLRTASWVEDVAEAEIKAAAVDYSVVLIKWKVGPPPAELKRKSLDLAQACRQSWLVVVERDFPDLADEIRREVYQQVKLFAWVLTKADGADAVRARQMVWEMYWGELGIVESPEVEAAMVKLGQVLTKWEADGHRPPELDSAVAGLVAACDRN